MQIALPTLYAVLQPISTFKSSSCGSLYRCGESSSIALETGGEAIVCAAATRCIRLFSSKG
jgi:hypothetical protein